MTNWEAYGQSIRGITPRSNRRTQRREILKYAQNTHAIGFFDAEDRVLKAMKDRDKMIEGLKFKRRGHVDFLGTPSIFPYASAFRQLATEIDVVETRAIKIHTPHNTHKANLFKEKIHGVSLLDIEGVPLPLPSDSIKMINRFYRDNRFTRVGRLGIPTRDIAFSLPVQAKIYPEQHVPSNLKPILSRLQQYYDYYHNIISQPSDDLVDQGTFLWQLSWVGGTFMQSLANYIAAERGISPASTAKFLESRPVHSNGRRGFKRLYEHAFFGLKGSYRSDLIPEKVAPFLEYDPKVDSAATKIINETMLAGDSSVASKDTANQLRPYKDQLKSDVLNSKDRYLEFASTPDEIAKRVLVASQNRKTLIFVVELADSAHLTLEIGADSQIYGVPPQLLKDDPHMGDKLADRFLDPVLDFARKKHPEVEPHMPVPYLINRSYVSQPRVVMENPQETVPAKRKHGSLRQIFQPEPMQIVAPVEVTEPKYKVRHSRRQILKMTGRIPERELDDIMELIARFEQTGQGYNKLEVADSLGTLRKGDRRLILRQDDTGEFDLIEIPNRGEAYNKRRFQSLLRRK